MCITKVREYCYGEMQKDERELLQLYPFLRRSMIGKSVLGRELSALWWGEGKRCALLCGAHHGNEWICALLLMRFVEFLCREYQNGNQRIRELYRQCCYVIVPMLNPDGVELSVRGLGNELPKEVREHLICANGGSEEFRGRWQANAHGVDLNHNYDAAFERGKVLAMRLGITEPGPTRFSGERPESEPESAALIRLTKKLHPAVCVAYHSQGEVIYADFEGKATQRALHIAEEMSRLSGYELDKTQGIASCSGYKDWVISEFSLPAYTVEVGHGVNPLPLAQFEEIWEKNLEMLLFLGLCENRDL